MPLRLFLEKGISAAHNRGFLFLSRRMTAALLLLGVCFFLLRAVAQETEEWKFSNVGGDVSSGSALYDETSDSFVLTSSGAGLGTEGGDSFAWVCRDLQAGDFEITVLLDGAGEKGWAGLIVRENKEPRAAGFFVGARPDGKVGTWNEPEGEGETAFPYPQAPVWLRLLKKGETVAALVSEDGSVWEELDSCKPGKGGLTVGLMTAGGTARFGSIRMRERPGKKGNEGGLEPEIGDPGEPVAASAEISLGTGKATEKAVADASSPRMNALEGKVVYVDGDDGSDQWDGKALRKLLGKLTGPKRTIQAARAEAGLKGTVVIQQSATPYPLPVLTPPEEGELIIAPESGKEIIIQGDNVQ
jgi:hypothetical protein